jgi:SNF2 family DNA or RNA helicase
MRKKTDLRDYQSRTVTTLYESDGHIAVLPMGAGKTASALTATDELMTDGHIRHGLVIAPKRVATNVWPDEIKQWQHLAGMTYAVLNGNPVERAEKLIRAAQRQLSVIGVDNTQWLVEELKKLPDGHPVFDLLIIDEISRFRNPKSKRAKALLTQASRFKMIWGLTGTPRPNGLEDLFKPCAIVSREALWGRSFYSWRNKRFYPTDWEQRNWVIKPDWEERTNAEAATLMSTLAPEDMPELPEINVIEHYVDLPPDALRAYRTMERRLFADIGSERVLAKSAGVASSKLGQCANGFMYDDAGKGLWIHDEKRQWIEDLVEDMNGNPLILVYEFIEDLTMFRELFGPNLPVIGDGISDSTASRIIADWNARRLPLLALHPASGGHGLNLQDGGSQMAWISLTWSPEFWEQTIKRIHRPGQKERCFIHVCLARATIDEAKKHRVLEKLSMQDAFRRYLREI